MWKALATLKIFRPHQFRTLAPKMGCAKDGDDCDNLTITSKEKLGWSDRIVIWEGVRHLNILWTTWNSNPALGGESRQNL